MNFENYKKCKTCDTWFSLEEIINDPDIKPIGMAYLEGEKPEAFYFFHHDVKHCGSSFLIKVDEFKSFITVDIPMINLMHSDQCDGYCVEIEEIRSCDKQCRYAPYRQFLLKMLYLKRVKLVKGN